MPGWRADDHAIVRLELLRITDVDTLEARRLADVAGDGLRVAGRRRV